MAFSETDLATFRQRLAAGPSTMAHSAARSGKKETQMADEFKLTESHAATRARLLAGGPKRARRTGGKPKPTQEEQSRALWSKVWKKINAENAPSDIGAAPTAAADQPKAQPTSDRVRAAFRRGMRSKE